MSRIKYTDDHEWIRAEDDGTFTVGITAHAQQHLGDVVFVSLPEVGTRLDTGQEAVVIESVKAAADIRMPMAGEVVARNDLLEHAPEMVNEAPMTSGWFLRIRADVPDDEQEFMDETAYLRLVGTSAGSS